MGYKKLKVCVCTSSRSERGLLKPLIRRLNEHPRMSVSVLELPTDFTGAYEVALEFLRTHRVDLAFCGFDRLEHFGGCLAFFVNQVPVAQVYAGQISGEGVWDDVVRHLITLCSTIQFCDSEKAYKRCLELLKVTDKPTDKCFLVGSLAFEDLELDESIAPNKKFDLVLYNPLPLKPDLIQKELGEIERLLDKPTIWIYPNEDKYRETVIERIKKLEAKGKVKGYKTLPRPQYLALLKNCERAIGNSSSFLLELPYFGKSHIHIGARNNKREFVEIRKGGSDRIVKILEKVIPELREH